MRQVRQDEVEATTADGVEEIALVSLHLAFEIERLEKPRARRDRARLDVDAANRGCTKRARSRQENAAAATHVEHTSAAKPLFPQ
jgi:hypothetical protein